MQERCDELNALLERQKTAHQAEILKLKVHLILLGLRGYEYMHIATCIPCVYDEFFSVCQVFELFSPCPSFRRA